MADHGVFQRAASTVRCAVAGKPMRTFAAPGLDGPLPRPGRVVERVEARRRLVTIVWDDGTALDTPIRGGDDWHVFRVDHDAAARSGDAGGDSAAWAPVRALHGSITITTDDWGATCRSAGASVYRLRDRRRHPAMGAPGPDLTRVAYADIDAAAATVVTRLLRLRQDIAIADALVDHRVARGLGNAYRSEALWLARIHPRALVRGIGEPDLERLALAAARCVRTHVDPEATRELMVYGRNGRPCHRCHSTITARQVGAQHHVVYWCPECQSRYAPSALPDDTPTMDPHPAAVQFLADLPWNR